MHADNNKSGFKHRHIVGPVLSSLDTIFKVLKVPELHRLPAGEGANTVLAGVLRGCGRQKVGFISFIACCIFGTVACQDQ